MNKRTPIVAGNWKLHHTISASLSLVETLKTTHATCPVELIVAPVFTALHAVGHVLKDSRIAVAAQNCYWQPQGAFTGEVSAELIKDVGASHVILGHSERRALFNEHDEDVAKKLKAVQHAGLTAIVCVGETLDERKAGKTTAKVRTQINHAFADKAHINPAKLIIAYEPVWAIGTGVNAEPSDAQEVHAMLRGELAALFGEANAKNMRILYGGSVKPDNAATLYEQPDIDGFLVGGASLDAGSFSAIVKAIENLLT